MGTEQCGDALVFGADRWKRIADLASKSGLSVLLFKGLPITSPALGIPKTVASRWLREYLVNASRNNGLYQNLEGILASLNNESIPVILLKGIYLMDAHYAERAMRTVGDIDILVQPQDKLRAMRVIEMLGYTGFTPRFHSPHSVKDATQHCFLHGSGHFILEVHHEIDTETPRGINISRFWERSLPVDINGKQALVLSPEDLFAHLCLHLTHHIIGSGLFPQCLRSLYEIALLMRLHSERTHWENLRQLLLDAQGERHFMIPIRLAEALLRVPAPPALGRSLGSAWTISPDELGFLTNHLFLSCEYDEMEASAPKFLRSSAMDGQGNFLRGFLKRAFISRAELSRRYGPPKNGAGLIGKYLLHFRALARDNFTPRKWTFGQESINLAKHFRRIGSLRERIQIPESNRGKH